MQPNRDFLPPHAQPITARVSGRAQTRGPAGSLRLVRGGVGNMSGIQAPRCRLTLKPGPAVSGPSVGQRETRSQGNSSTTCDKLPHWHHHVLILSPSCPHHVPIMSPSCPHHVPPRTNTHCGCVSVCRYVYAGSNLASRPHCLKSALSPTNTQTCKSV